MKSRLDEVMNIIKDERKTVRDTAAAMHWELRYNRWEDFPNPQKWFAAGRSYVTFRASFTYGKKLKEQKKMEYCTTNLNKIIIAYYL